MKEFLAALNNLQIACMKDDVPLENIGKARKEIFIAVRRIIIDGMNTSSQADFLAKFDKFTIGDS